MGQAFLPVRFLSEIPPARAQDGFAQPGADVQAGVILRDLAQFAERAFRHDARNARLRRGRLQSNRRAHRFAERKQAVRLLPRIVVD